MSTNLVPGLSPRNELVRRVVGRAAQRAGVVVRFGKASAPALVTHRAGARGHHDCVTNKVFAHETLLQKKKSLLEKKKKSKREQEGIATIEKEKQTKKVFSSFSHNKELI
jgi:hypothetical protein